MSVKFLAQGNNGLPLIFFFFFFLCKYFPYNGKEHRNKVLLCFIVLREHGEWRILYTKIEDRNLTEHLPDGTLRVYPQLNFILALRKYLYLKKKFAHILFYNILSLYNKSRLPAWFIKQRLCSSLELVIVPYSRSRSHVKQRKTNKQTNKQTRQKILYSANMHQILEREKKNQKYRILFGFDILKFVS